MIPHHRKNAGFTLIEILVVVAIIALLISILIPALAGARKRARIVDTTSLMDNLQSDIDSFYQQFNTYPGPFPTAQTTSTNSASKLSGTQNLLLGLTYALRQTTDIPPANVAPSTSPPSVSLTSVVAPVVTSWIDPTMPNGPLDRGSLNPSGGFNQLSPFFSPTKRELSPPIPGTQLWLPTGIAANTAIPFNKFNFPTIIDHFPDPLPILYYRKTPGVEGTSANVDSKGNVITQPNGASAATAPIAAKGPSTGVISSYYLDENEEYTDGSVTITSPSGASFPQAGAAGAGLTANQLATFACTVIPPVPPSAVSTATSRGGYFLISAGPSRTYGVAVNASVSDNIVVVGGQ